MKWNKRGLVYRGQALAPSAVALDERTIRVYFGKLDDKGISRIAYADVDAADPVKVLRVSEKPVLDIGRKGMFDDNGVFPAHASKIGGQIYFYYTGFQLRTDVRYTMFGGLALSADGSAFGRAQETPVTGPAPEGRYFRGGPCALFEDGAFKFWYSSGSVWEEVGGKQRPTYDIYFQPSPDGKSIGPAGRLCVAYDRNTEHGLGRPQVLKTKGLYRMFYTRRTKDMKYAMGYAESPDGLTWTRRDDAMGLEHSPSGWDSQMVYFPSIVETGGRTLMFYNGNDFGKDGFGLAELVSW